MTRREWQYVVFVFAGAVVIVYGLALIAARGAA